MVDGDETDSGRPTGKEKAWAVVRIVLGQTQMIGAVVSLYLLIQTGVNVLSLGAVVFTCFLTTTSVLLFRSWDGNGR